MTSSECEGINLDRLADFYSEFCSCDTAIFYSEHYIATQDVLYICMLSLWRYIIVLILAKYVKFWVKFFYKSCKVCWKCKKQEIKDHDDNKHSWCYNSWRICGLVILYICLSVLSIIVIIRFFMEINEFFDKLSSLYDVSDFPCKWMLTCSLILYGNFLDLSVISTITFLDASIMLIPILCCALATCLITTCTNCMLCCISTSANLTHKSDIYCGCDSSGCYCNCHVCCSDCGDSCAQCCHECCHECCRGCECDCQECCTCECAVDKCCECCCNCVLKTCCGEEERECDCADCCCLVIHCCKNFKCSCGKIDCCSCDPDENCVCFCCKKLWFPCLAGCCCAFWSILYVLIGVLVSLFAFVVASICFGVWIALAIVIPVFFMTIVLMFISRFCCFCFQEDTYYWFKFNKTCQKELKRELGFLQKRKFKFDKRINCIRKKNNESIELKVKQMIDPEDEAKIKYDHVDAQFQDTDENVSDDEEEMKESSLSKTCIDKCLSELVFVFEKLCEGPRQSKCFAKLNELLNWISNLYHRDIEWLNEYRQNMEDFHEKFYDIQKRIKLLSPIIPVICSIVVFGCCASMPSWHKTNITEKTPAYQMSTSSHIMFVEPFVSMANFVEYIYTDGFVAIFQFWTYTLPRIVIDADSFFNFFNDYEAFQICVLVWQFILFVFVGVFESDTDS